MYEKVSGVGSSQRTKRVLFVALVASLLVATAAIGTAVAQNTATGETVYVGSEDTQVYALDNDASDESNAGDRIWSTDIDDDTTASSSITGIKSSPTVSDGTVYVGGGDGLTDGLLVALNADDGSEAWVYDAPSADVVGSPTVKNGVVYITDANGIIHALNANNGNVQWTHDVGSAIFGSPNVAETSEGNRLFIGAFDDTMYSFNLDDLSAGNTPNGEPNIDWQQSSPFVDWVVSSPTYDAETGRVFAGDFGENGDANIVALDANDGSVLWSETLTGSVLSAPVTNDGSMFIGDFSETLFAFDKTATGSGGQEASFGANDWVLNSPAFDPENNVYVGDFSGNFYGLDSGLNQVDDFTGASDSIRDLQAITYFGGDAYFGSLDSRVYAVDGISSSESDDATSVSEEWNELTGDEVESSPTVVSNPSGDSVDSRITDGALGHNDAFPGGTTVGASGDFQSIQAAIDNAGTGAVIEVLSDYDPAQDTNIEARVARQTIKPADPNNLPPDLTADGSSGSFVMDVQADGVTVQGLPFDGSTSSVDASTKSNQGRAGNVLAVTSGTSVTISGNTITGTDLSGSEATIPIAVASNDPTQRSEGVEVRNNDITITGESDGIWASSPYATIQNNRIESQNWEAALLFGDNTEFVGNNIVNSEAGVKVSSSNTVVENNDIDIGHDPDPSQALGIWSNTDANQADNSVIRGNTITLQGATQWGIWLRSGTGWLVEDNTLEDSGTNALTYAVLLEPSADGVDNLGAMTFRNNDLTGLNDATVANGVTITDDVTGAGDGGWESGNPVITVRENPADLVGNNPLRVTDVLTQTPKAPTADVELKR